MTNEKYAQEQIEKATKAATKQAEDMAEISKSGFEAWMKSMNTYMDGATTMFKTWTTYNNDLREKQANAMKELMACKTLNDVTETSTRVMQQSMEQSMTCATDISEKGVKLCMQTMEPINDQISKGFQKTIKNATKAA